MPTPKITRSWTDAEGNSISYEKEISGEAIHQLNKTVPAGTTDMALVCAIDVSQLQGLLLAADGALTIELNNPGGSSAAADQTLELTANQAILWADGDAEACPIDQDVAILYVTNAGDSDVELKVRWIEDADL